MSLHSMYTIRQPRERDDISIYQSEREFKGISRNPRRAAARRVFRQWPFHRLSRLRKEEKLLWERCNAVQTRIVAWAH